MATQTNVQNLINKFSSVINLGNAETATNQNVAFINPHGSSLVQLYRKKAAENAAARGESGQKLGDMVGIPQDSNIYRQKIQLARQYAQKTNPDADGDKYYHFFCKMKQKDEESGATTSSGNREEGEETAEDAGEDENAVPKNWEKKLENLNPRAKKLIQQLQSASGEITEQYNILDYADTALKMDVKGIDGQLKKAQSFIERLQNGSADPEKIKKQQDKIAALEKELEETKLLSEQTSDILRQLNEKFGQKIKDGFNLLPKSYGLLAELRSENVNADELTKTYRDEVLTMKDTPTFFENFLRKHKEMGFKKYMHLILQLLGADIISVNPSREPPLLMGIQDGLFMAQMSFQFFENIGRLTRRTERFFALREKETGTYIPRYMVINYSPEAVTMSTTGKEKKVANTEVIPIKTTHDPFELISETMDSTNVDEIIFACCDDLTPEETQDKNLFARGLRMKYGLPTHLIFLEKDATPIDVGAGRNEQEQSLAREKSENLFQLFLENNDESED